MKYEEKERDEVIKIIKEFYPQECAFYEKKYRDSVEYKKYNYIVNNLNSRDVLEERFYNMLCVIFQDYYVKRWTNTTYPSIQFSVLLHKNQPILDDDIELMSVLQGKRYNLEIFISRISPYYYAYTSEERYVDSEWSFEIHPSDYILEVKYLRQLEKEMFLNGMKKLSRKLAHTSVPFVETELLPRDGKEVEIFNCLFSDMVTTYY